MVIIEVEHLKLNFAYAKLHVSGTEIQLGQKKLSYHTMSYNSQCIVVLNLRQRIKPSNCVYTPKAM